MSTPLPIFIVLIVVSAALTIAGDYIQPRRPWLIYTFKPGTTALILALVLASGTFMTTPYARWVFIGLLFSLMGDIWLMLPQDRFLYGLASFLVAQLCYAFAFAEGASARGFGEAALALSAVGIVVLRYLWKGLPRGMRPPVVVYVVAILSMAALAAARALGQPSAGSSAAAIGALLFVASDATLAINRFARPFRLAQGAVWVTYFAAQFLIAASTFKT